MRERLTRALLPLSMALASLPAYAQTATNRPGYWHDDWGWGGGHMLFGGLMMILFWGGIILVIFLVVRWLNSGPSHGATSPTSRNKALDILRERFARGEIEKDEFEERKRLLSD